MRSWDAKSTCLFFSFDEVLVAQSILTSGKRCISYPRNTYHRPTLLQMGYLGPTGLARSVCWPASASLSMQVLCRPIHGARVQGFNSESVPTSNSLFSSKVVKQRMRHFNFGHAVLPAEYIPPTNAAMLGMAGPTSSV